MLEAIGSADTKFLASVKKQVEESQDVRNKEEK